MKAALEDTYQGVPNLLITCEVLVIEGIPMVRISIHAPQ